MQRDGPKWREHLPKSESYSNLMQFETRYLENAVKNKPSNNGRQSEDEEVGAQIDGIMEGGMKNSVDEKPTEKEMKDKENKEKDEKEKFQMIKDSGNKYVQKVSEFAINFRLISKISRKGSLRSPPTPSSVQVVHKMVSIMGLT